MSKRSHVETIFEAHGLDCAVLAIDMGHRCGYVRVPEGHPWFGLRYWDGTDGHVQPLNARGLPDWEHADHDRSNSIECALEVHGGITFTDDRPSDDEALTTGWWFGFDCAHLYDAKDPDIMSDEHKALLERHGDFSEPEASIRTQAYVEGECRRLAEQLAKVPQGHAVQGTTRTV